MKKKIDFLIAPETKEYVKLCRRYFEYLEKLPDSEVTKFWPPQLRMLTEIYVGVLRLPLLEGHYSSDIEKFVTEREYNRTLSNLRLYLGAMDKFPDFNDMAHPGLMKVVEASLAEVLTDIYQELKDFVLLYETGTLENMNDAIVECFETFGKYWGVKLLTALRIVHINLYEQRYAEEKKKSQKFEELHDDDDFDEDLDLGDFEFEEDEADDFDEMMP